jgi:hypothetical protein
VGRLVGNGRLAVDLRVLQYGVTRDSLREALEDGEGWDAWRHRSTSPSG